MYHSTSACAPVTNISNTNNEMNKGTVLILSAAQVRVNKDIETLKLEVRPGVHDIIHIKQEEHEEGVAVEDSNKALVKQVVDSCRPLLKADPADPEAVEKVTRAKEQCRQMRLAVEKWHKQAKADALFVGKALDNYKNELVRDGVELMEAACEDFITKAANLKEAELAAENARIDERYKQRYIALTERLGMAYNGITHVFEIGSASVTQDIVRLSDDAALKALLQKHVMPEVQRIKDEQVKAAAERESVAALLKEQQETNEAKAKAEIEQAAFDRKREEENAEKLRALRASVLIEAGARQNGMILYAGLLNIGYPQLNEFTEEAFGRKVQEVKDEITRLRSLAASIGKPQEQETSMPVAELDKLTVGTIADYNDRDQVMSITEDLQAVFNKMNEDHYTSEIAKHSMREMQPRIQYVLNWMKGCLRDL